MLIPFPPETAFTFSTKAIEWLAIRPCLWYAEQEKIKDRSGRDGRSERFTGHNNHPGRLAGEKWATEKVIEHYAPFIDGLAVDEDMKQHLILKLLEELPNFPLEQA